MTKFQEKQDSKRLTRFKQLSSTALVLAVTAPAMAMPDTTAAVDEISAGGTVVDTVGLAVIGLFVTIMTIGIVVGMIARKGK